METKPQQQPECCPEFDPVNWDDQIVVWKNKRFIKDRVLTAFFMPLNFGTAMRRLDKMVRGAGAAMPDSLCLSYHTSMWNMELYLAVDREVPAANNIKLRGKYYCKVFEGPFRDTGKWTKSYDQILKEKGLRLKKMYMWYTTCPKCAKKFGRNYVVIVGEIES